MAKFHCESCGVDHDPDELITVTMPYRQIIALIMFSHIGLSCMTRMTDLGDKVKAMREWAEIEHEITPEILGSMLSLAQALPHTDKRAKSVEVIREQLEATKRFYRRG